MYIDSEYKNDYGENLNRSRYGNHLITYSLYDGKSFYLDSTQDRIYRLRESKGGVLYDSMDDKILIKKDAFRIMNDRDDKNSYALRKKIFIPNDTISLEDEKKIITSTLDICKNNLDIFDRFYNDNKEIYEEISNKLVKIRIR